MSCTTCARTKPLNECFLDINFGSFPVGNVTINLVSTVDRTRLTLTGVSTGTLTVARINLPSFVSNVDYIATASDTWTLGGEVRQCVIIRFEPIRNATGWELNTNEVLEVE